MGRCAQIEVIDPRSPAIEKKEYDFCILGKGYEEWINYFSSVGADWENVRGTEGDSSEIYSRYYLQNIPTIYLLKGNVVVAKDINDNELKNILNSITQ